MHRRGSIVAIGVVAFMLVAATAGASQSYPWRNHAAPFDFTFDNHIDTHHQSKQLASGKMLQGFFYITFTGDTDEGSGLPIAEHGNCAAGADCEVGWIWHGVALDAKYCGHPDGGGHPSWDLSEDASNYTDQGYSHFHWLNESEHADGLTVGRIYQGYLLKLTAIDSFFFAHHGGFPITPGIETASHANLIDC